MWVHTFPSIIMYIYIRSHLPSFLCSKLCATAACITMPRLDIDTSGRVVFSRVFLKSAGYSISQIKNGHRQTILIASIFSYRLPTKCHAKREEFNGDSISNKGSISTWNDSTPNNREWDTARSCTWVVLVGELIQKSIETYWDNVRKFIVYIQLILSFIRKVNSKWVERYGHTCLTICLMRAQT